MSAADRPVRPQGDDTLLGVPEVWLLPTGQVAIQVGEDSWRVVEPEDDDHHVYELPADAVRLVPAGGSAPADEPDWEEEGVLGWLVGKGHDVELDATGQGEPTFRIGDDHVTRDRAVRLRDALSAALAGGSAPHQGATTDATAPAQHPEGEAACTSCKGHGIVTDPGYSVPGEQFVEPPSEDMCDACAGTGASHVQRLVSQRTAVLARLDAIESNDTFRRILSGYLPSTIFTSEVRALLGAGETTEETHD